MTVDDIRHEADDPYMNGHTMALLRALAAVMEAADTEDSHTGANCETVNCGMCAALAVVEALPP